MDWLELEYLQELQQMVFHINLMDSQLGKNDITKFENQT